MPTDMDLGAVYAFVMDNWIMVAVIALVVIQVIKKVMRLTKRALYVMYTLSGGFAGMGIIRDIIEQLLDK